MPAPMRFELELLIRDGDTFFHQASMSVPTVSHTQMVATLRSTGYRDPVVTEVDQFGSLDLDPLLQERVLLEMFPTLIRRMHEYDGDRIAYQSADLEPWIRQRFTPRESEELLTAIAEAVPPGRAFEDMCCIDIG